MDVIIVGAGIAGLAAAIGLRRAGHTVVVVEKSSSLNEVGAAIHIPPNASRILSQWGFDFERAMVDLARVAVNFDGKTLELIGVPKDLTTIEENYGAPWFFCHRADLHGELKLLATQQDGDGAPVKILVKTCVKDIDPEAGTITLEDSSILHGDLIIAADGVHSFASNIVLGQPVPAVPTNMSAFRFLIPTEDIAQDETCQRILKYDGSMKLFLGEGDKRVVWYPCRKSQMQNFAAIHPDSSISRAREEWNVKTSVSEFLAEFGNFHPDLLRICSKGTDFKLWKLLYREPIPTWYRSRLVVIGDAAHPMLPHQGQGGAQAIEDGAALSLIFSPPLLSAKLADITSRLALFESIRKPRASLLQIFSLVGQEEADRIKDKAAKYLPDGEVVPSNPQEFYEWNFSYNIFEHCASMLAKEKTSVSALGVGADHSPPP